MPDTVLGHHRYDLVVYLTMAAATLAALLVLLAVAWPGFRRRVGVLPAVATVVALVLYPLSRTGGEGLVHGLPHAALLHGYVTHARDYLSLLVVLAVTSVLLWLLARRAVRKEENTRAIATRPATERLLVVVLSLCAAAASVGIGVQTARVVHGGLTATEAESLSGDFDSPESGFGAGSPGAGTVRPGWRSGVDPGDLPEIVDGPGYDGD